MTPLGISPSSWKRIVGGNLDEQLARAHDEARVGVADAGGEHVERARHAGVAVGAEEDFAGARVALGRQRGVADARVARAELLLELAARLVENPVAVRVVDHVVEIGQALLAHEIAQDVHVAVGKRVGGEDVVIGDDHDLVLVPDLGGLAELALEDADGARPAHVVGQQHIGLHPDIIAGRRRGSLPLARASSFSVKVEGSQERSDRATCWRMLRKLQVFAFKNRTFKHLIQ